MVDLPTWPTNAADASEDRWSKMERRKFADGVWDTTDTSDLAVFADSTGMQVKVPTGQAIIRGFHAENASTQTLAVGAANGSNPRIDRVVARLDRSATPIVKLLVVPGTAATTPQAPALVDTSTLTDVSIALVAVGAAVSTITAANVTDARRFAVPAGLPFRWARWTNVLNGAGTAGFAHGIRTEGWSPTQWISLQGWYKGNSNEALPLVINYVDATNISVTGAIANRQFYVVGTYIEAYQPVPGWA